ncbi:DUF6297 family protein [Actinopolymorpha alba]|uniref:DUF6297 family protein n=1 Tax=Actinopolymorpha alba TaxID=533267 RepID=UPI000372ED2A|nr:DUF6297 family protein [Actinopolymorpha alba]
MTAPVRAAQPVAAVPSARALRKELRARRRAHSDRTLRDALEDLYLWVFGVLMLGSMTGAVAVRLWAEISRCDTASCVNARDVVPLPLGVGVLALLLRALMALGPVWTSRAGSTFLLGTPVDRRGLLARHVRALLVGGLLGGALLVATLVLLASTRPDVVGLGAAAGAALGLTVVAGAVVAQRAPGARRVLSILSDALVLLALTAVPVFLLGVDVPAAAWARPVPLAVAAVAGSVVAGGLVVAVFRGLGRVQRRDVVAGGELLAGLSGAAASMDTSMLADVLVARRFRLLGAARSRRGRWTGLVAVAYREALRSLRSPHRLVLAVGLLVLPYAVDRLGVPSVTPLVAGALGYLAVRPFSGGLHTVARSAGLRRGFPVADFALRMAFTVPLLAAAGVWSVVAAPTVAGPSQLALFGLATNVPLGVGWAALAATIAAAAIRSATRKPVSYEGPLISTPAGALPAGFVGQVFRGPDFLLVGIAPLTFGLPWPLTLGVPLLLLLVSLRRG